MSFELATFDVDKAGRLALAFSQSGYFADARDVQKAMVKIVAGAELGIGPMQSMMGIHVIEGKPAVGAGIMAAKVKGHAKYDYRVLELTDTNCSLEFYELVGEEWDPLGKSDFSIEDATKAGAQFKSSTGKPTAWVKFPRNMLFARALSNGLRWYCPDALTGGPVYTAEELGAEIDEHGDYIDATATVVNGKGHAPAPRGAASDVNNLLEDEVDVTTPASTEPVTVRVVVNDEKAVEEIGRTVDEETGEIIEVVQEPDGVVLDILAALDSLKGDAGGLANLWNTELRSLPADVQAEVRPRFDELMTAARAKTGTRSRGASKATEQAELA